MDPTAIGWSPESLAPEGGRVAVRWLGTAGFEIRCGEHVLLIDPYVTRASLRRCAFSSIAPDAAALRRYAPRADAIVLGHTHFDHALDVPAIAKATGARVFGSRSAAALCLGQGVDPARVEAVERAASSAPVEREVGPFQLRFHPSAHARLLLGRVPFPGEIADCEDVPMRISAYRCGAVFGVEIRVARRTLFHLGSAELLDVSLGRIEANLVMLCVAGWTKSRDLPERVARALSPAAVLLAHWDNFLVPMERGARLLPAMQMGRLVERLARAAPDVRVGTLPLLGEVVV
jgi:L-ascorbate metabolism protein UlaG (beta-lactamase superfamily)